LRCDRKFFPLGIPAFRYTLTQCLRTEKSMLMIEPA
jgi:hypothetical protein